MQNDDFHMKHGSHTWRTSCLSHLMFVWEKHVLSQNPTWKSKNNPFEQGIRPPSELACLDIAIRQRWTAWKLKLKNWCSAQRCSHVGCGRAFMATSFGGRMTRKFGICCFNNFFTKLFETTVKDIFFILIFQVLDLLAMEMFLDHFGNLVYFQVIWRDVSTSRVFPRHLGARGVLDLQLDLASNQVTDPIFSRGVWNSGYVP